MNSYYTILAPTIHRPLKDFFKDFCNKNRLFPISVYHFISEAVYVYDHPL